MNIVLPQTRTRRRDDAELLRCVVAGLAPGEAGAAFARRLLDRFGAIAAVMRAEPEEIDAIPGAPPGAGEEIRRQWLILERVAFAQAQHRPLLDNPSAAISYCRLLVAGERLEKLYVLFLDKGFRLTGRKLMQRGTVDHVTLYPREVLAAALARAASAVVLVHNHPGGDPAPSAGDIAATGMLCEAARPLGMIVADHIIVGDRECFSFRRNGLMPEDGEPARDRRNPARRS